MEKGPRGWYSGVLGWFTPEASETSIIIRTIELTGSTAEIGVGGGITVHSDWASEYAECMLKADRLVGAIRNYLSKQRNV
ncbi:chorismate-binding protein [Corynebacterium mastitidis]|uniref:chorismate-binding protein n=1 Tax=Corynebacterium mastitidis TaxID=161890 RepID=UPI003CC800DD